jgi:Fe-S cluster biogenesis protein NfuA
VKAPRGAIADKVQELLDQQVNPSIASHGGKILLADVQGTEIYMEMTGGCQGCAMSRMTLRQGVEKMIRQAIPEITAIHDITDHASGENPYFTD